jgi:hemoglobin/transferrin/lactoferrin receptor protein
VRTKITSDLAFYANVTTIRAEDELNGLPPNIEGGTPPAMAFLSLRYAPVAHPLWVEVYSTLADDQNRLSSLDLADRRTGATRSRSSIASFFANGATFRGLVGPDGILIPTGETLAEVQARVLGPSGATQSLFTAIPGYVVFGVRGALRFGDRHEILVDLENLGDESYRGISWGMDAPGRSIFLRYSLRF